MTIWNPRLDVDPGDAPLYLNLARAIEADVRAGVLAPGDRLPTHRDLADRLGVNVGTISRAYAECERGGWIQGEVGRGTFVRGAAPRRVEDRFSGLAPDPAAGVIDLGLNVPVSSLAPDLADALRSLAAEIEGLGAGARRSSEDGRELLDYPPPQGALRDREAGVQVLAAHGVPAPVERVTVCAGGQHGLAVCLGAVCRPGDTVAAEQLAYPGLRALAEARGLRVEPVEMDAHGIVADAFERACTAVRPRALYLAPTFQNPTACTLPAERREQIAEIARRHGVFLIEDDVHRMLEPDGPPPLAALAPELTLYVASLSKCLAPGLRVGWIAAPGALHDRVVEEVWSSIWSVSPLTTALAAAWVRDGTFARVAKERRDEARARQELAGEVFAGLPAGFGVRSAPTACHAWLELGEGWNATSFASTCRERGVGVSPADAFFLGRAAPPAAVRVSYSAASDRATLARALAVLVQVAAGRAAVRVRL
jgi:DNA-binding transcriptional MocR family regulator